MPKLSQTATRKRRALPKAERRNQLIRATIKCIAKKGLAATTMADITNEADLSVGIVNLHFKTKEQLLIETLRFVADEYKEGFDQIFANEGMQGLEKLKAIIDYDFSPKIINRNKLAVWFAFLGEVKARPIYQKICAQHDDEINREICKLFSSLLSKNSKRKDDFELIASAYSALTDGLWLDILLSPRRSAVEAARNAAWQYVSGLLD
jgi:TetR/AcrR family transcriptional repressor of bet genes|tara:strand:+ start:122 stop:745 length:624 start_codon:yes stop_codon:yes gene_type:complete